MADDALRNLENTINLEETEKTETEPNSEKDQENETVESETLDSENEPDDVTKENTEIESDISKETDLPPESKSPIQEDVNLKYSVVLNALGDKEMTVIFTLSEMLGVTPDEVQELVTKLPVVLISGWELEDANVFFDELSTLGASVEIKKEE